jgi:NADH dehydrogenase FAD-containing subunit
VYLYQHTEGIEYDHLVICTGSSYADPWKTQNKKDGETITLQSRIDFLSQQREKYQQAQEILCIGGGPVGVELITEIAYRSPSKKLTLVDSNPVVLHSAPDNLGDHAQLIINAQPSIKSILNEKCNKKSEGVYETDKSHTEIKADLVYNCIGVTPNTLYLEESHSDWLNEKKQIKVDCYLQVVDGKIFAIGDVNSVQEPKMFYTAHMQAIHFVKNLKRLLNKDALKPYAISRANMVVSMGPSYAIGHVSGMNLTGWPLGLKRGSKVAAYSKYMIERITMDDFGLKVPVNEVLYCTSRPLHHKSS